MFPVQCYLTKKKTIKEIYSTLPSIVKRFFFTLKIALNTNSYCDNPTFHFGVLKEENCTGISNVVPLIPLMVQEAVKLTALYQMDF